MADWEETAFLHCKKLPLRYYRYHDDVWGIWTHSEEDFHEFVQTLNNQHDSIQLDPVLNEQEVNFLDTTVFKGADFAETGILDTKVYFKPTDTHALLHRKSFHPKHVFKGIYKSQLLRFNRICCKSSDRIKATKTLTDTLRQRGYQRTFLREIQKETFHNSMGATRDPNPNNPTQNKTKVIPLITTYSNYAMKDNKILKDNIENVLSQTTLPKNFRIISAYKKNPTLKDTLVRAKLHTPRTKDRPPTNIRI